MRKHLDEISNMPIYTYRCNNCGIEFEKRQRMSDDPLSDCPTCDGQVRRIVNAVGVVFKGSGFYITDSRNGKNASLGSGSNDTPSPKPEKTSETAPTTPSSSSSSSTTSSATSSATAA